LEGLSSTYRMVCSGPVTGSGVGTSSSGGGLVVLAGRAVEGQEQPLHLLRRDAGAGVLHGDRDPALGRGSAGDADDATVMVVLDGVGGEVQQHLLEPLPVGLDDPAAVPGGWDLEGDLPLGGQRAR